MAELGETLPTTALEDVAYLSRSEHRIRILGMLAKGAHTRRELRESTGIPRATLGRIVNELEDREWAERTTDGDYVATPTGEHVAAQFTPLVESIEAVRTLGEAIEWLPTDELSIGLHHFSDAIVKRPEQNDPMEVIDYFTDVVRTATDIRVLTHFAPPGPFAESMHDGFTSERLTGTFVLTGDLVEYLADRSDRRNRWHDQLEAGADVSRYDGEIPCNLWVIDGTVFVKSSQPGSVQLSYAAPIVSENETVRSWADELIDTYREDAEPVPAGTFAGDP